MFPGFYAAYFLSSYFAWIYPAQNNYVPSQGGILFRNSLPLAFQAENHKKSQSIYPLIFDIDEK